MFLGFSVRQNLVIKFLAFWAPLYNQCQWPIPRQINLQNITSTPPQLNSLTALVFGYGYLLIADLTRFCCKKYQILTRLHFKIDAVDLTDSWDHRVESLCNFDRNYCVGPPLGSLIHNTPKFFAQATNSGPKKKKQLQSWTNQNSLVMQNLWIWLRPLLLGFLPWQLFFSRSCNICFCIYIFFGFSLPELFRFFL